MIKRLWLSAGLAAALVLAGQGSAWAQKAGDQLKYSKEGDKQRDHVFDGTKKPADPVPAGKPKPTTAEQRIEAYKNSGKPTGAQTLKTNPVPLPGVQPSSGTASGYGVQKSSGTAGNSGGSGGGKTGATSNANNNSKPGSSAANGKRP